MFKRQDIIGEKPHPDGIIPLHFLKQKNKMYEMSYTNY